MKRPGLLRAILGGLAGGTAGGALGSLGATLGAAEDTDPFLWAGVYLFGLVGWLWGVGALGPWFAWAAGRIDRIAPEHGAPGVRRYFEFTTDHKVIGVQYLVTSFVFFVVAGLLALVMRVHLALPGSSILDLHTYTTFMSIHGTVMVAVALISLSGGMGNYLLPLMIGARDMAFPRLNALSYWMLPPAALLILSSPFAGGLDSGWTAYPPLSERLPLGQQFYIFTLITVGASSILGAVNFLATFLGLRAPGMSWSRVPIFVWSIVAMSIIALITTSVLAATLIMLLFDRLFGAAFFDPARGGDPILYQHLFWFYSHPAVYIMAVPGFGAILEILPVHARKPLFAYRLVVGSFLAIVVLSLVVWAHHMFVSGMPEALAGPFMVLTELISVPTGVVFLSALGTIFLGRLRLVTPMLYALGFVSTFVVGGLTGIFLADVPTDIALTQTYFVVAHFHYTIMGATIFALFASIYHWFPKITGRAFDERLGRIQFGLFYLAFNAAFLPLFWVGLHGMRRRVAEVPPETIGANVVSSVAAFLLALSVLLFVVNIIRAWVRGPRAAANPWDAHTLEWQVASPPPPENFRVPVTVVGGPYPYGLPGGQHVMPEALE